MSPGRVRRQSQEEKGELESQHFCSSGTPVFEAMSPGRVRRQSQEEKGELESQHSYQHLYLKP